MKFFQAAASSPVPHVDLEHTIQVGMKEAAAALGGGKSMAARAGN